MLKVNFSLKKVKYCM